MPRTNGVARRPASQASPTGTAGLAGLEALRREGAINPERHRSRTVHRMTEPQILFEGLSFGEGPRWHEDASGCPTSTRIACSRSTTPARRETIVEVPNRPSGLGWLPDGRLLVVSMTDRKLMRLDPSGLVVHADLGGIATGDCNDMVVDKHGRAYVGNFGYDFAGGAALQRREARAVSPDGAVTSAADELAFPNGTVITPDDSTLILGETMGRRLTVFDVASDGTLSNRRVWADLGDVTPDGICLDEAGGIWVADPTNSQCVRVARRGRGHRSHPDRAGLLRVHARRTPMGARCISSPAGSPATSTVFSPSRPVESRRCGSTSRARVDRDHLRCGDGLNGSQARHRHRRHGHQGGPCELETGDAHGDRFRLLTPKPATPKAVADDRRRGRRSTSTTRAPSAARSPAVVKHGVMQTAVERRQVVDRHQR